MPTTSSRLVHSSPPTARRVLALRAGKRAAPISGHAHLAARRVCRQAARALRQRLVLIHESLLEQVMMRAIKRVEGATDIDRLPVTGRRRLALELLVAREFVKQLSRCRRDAVKRALAKVPVAVRKSIAADLSRCVIPRALSGEAMLKCMDPREWKLALPTSASREVQDVIVGFASRYLKAQDRGASAARDSAARKHHATALAGLVVQTLGGS